MPLFTGTQQQYYNNSQSFTGDGSTTAFTLTFSPLPVIASDFRIFINGSEADTALYDSTPYNNSSGVVTFDAAPANGAVILVQQTTFPENFGNYQFIGIDDIINNFIPELRSEFPQLEFELEGTSNETVKLLNELTVASVAALFLIYILIAIPLKSYIQPIVIMSVIPFGLIGAVIGHIVLDEAISMFSLFGLVALAGVVVNDSIIMVDFINKAREEGVGIIDAVVTSGTQRFRAISLTSLTTAIGLMPIMLETSTQAQFVIPMAISISFGIIFATVITLFLIPCLYVLQDDFIRKVKSFGRTVFSLEIA